MIIGHITVTYAAGKSLGKWFPALSYTALLLFGALLPDLIDKPLSLVLGFLSRGLAHSIIIQAVLFVAIFALFQKYRERAVPVLIGVLFHLAEDFVPAAILLWPLLGPLPAEIHTSFIEKIINYYVYMVAPLSLFIEILSYPLAIYFLFGRIKVSIPDEAVIPDVESS